MTEGTEQTQIDIGSVLHRFDKWHMAMMSLQTTRSSLEDSVEYIKKENQELQQKNSKLQKELGDMQEMISNISKQLHHVCKLEDELKFLKREITSKNLTIGDLQKEMVELKDKHVSELKELEERQNNNLKVAVEYAEKQGQEQADRLKKKIFDREQTIDVLRQEVEKAGKDKQAEVVRITMEYESKINKLQRQKHQNVTTQSSAATQEIFRKKLQFIKVESEKEISDLKRTIAELQQRIANIQREPTKLSLSIGKKRRF